MHGGIRAIKRAENCLCRIVSIRITVMTDLQYVTDASGHKTAVILPIDDFEEILEDLHFGEAARGSKDEPTRDFNTLLDEMRSAGEIDV